MRHSSLQPRASSLVSRGFTLIETLVALFVLMIGLSAVVALVLGAGKMANAASDRNVAAMIIAEAVPDIERRHLVTGTIANTDPAHVGLLVETVNAASATPIVPNTHDGISYQNIKPNWYSSAASWEADMIPPYMLPAPALDAVHTLMWPLKAEDPKYYGGPLRQSGGGALTSGTPYRVVYRLERHPEWHPHTIDVPNGLASYGVEIPNSGYAGVYVLTLTVYRDPTKVGARLEQISDPVVVFLRDKRVR
jgi:Tfp pilus assembly protein PilV